MPSKPKVAIIGVGLLGGSLALALKKKNSFQLVGWNHRPSSRKKAARLLPVVPTFEKAIQGSSIVVLCSHSGSMGPVLRELAKLIQQDTLILDVSSVKGEVVKEAAQIFGMKKHFVPCHPMAGKEKSGPAHADPLLYKGKIVFVTPLPGSSASLIQRAVRFWKGIGAVPLLAKAAVHDQSVALTSHLPHLLASALIELYGQKQGKSPLVRQAVGSGFRDFTRIAAGNPAMWRDIVQMNAGPLRNDLSRYRRRLQELETNLKKGKGSFWFSFFERARDLREKL